MESRRNIPKKKKKNINGITKKIPKGLHIAPDLSKGAINRANIIKKLEAEAAKAMKKKKGGKIQYRSIGGKVLDGNDITKMIYD